MKNKKIVLDSFAVLAYFQKESHSHRVVECFQSAQKRDFVPMLSLINWGEVYYIIARSRGKNQADQCLLLMEQLPIQLINISKDLVLKAAYLKARYAISYSDCFAVALAQKEQCAVLTGDPEFKKVKEEVQINWL